MQKNTQMEKFIYTNKEFGLRLAKLREQRHVSARQMSLDLGQNKNYISSIESGNNYPTMGNFFDICLYLRVSPENFFKTKEHFPIANDDFIDLVIELPQKPKEHLYLFLLDLLGTGHFSYF